MAISTASGKLIKPEKPRPDFPLFPHATRRWAKKIRGRLHYFGPWVDSTSALNTYLDQKDDLYAGRVPRAKRKGELEVQELTDRFLTSKRHLLDTRELSPHTFREYYAICRLIVKEFHGERIVSDLRPEDFERLRAGLPKTWGPARRGKSVQIVRCVFRFAADEDLIDRPVKFGKSFKRPSKKTMRLQRAKNGKRMFEAAELRKILKVAGRPLRAMILLACNTGFGNNDVSSLPLDALNLENGWVDFPRPKTGIPRHCPLWPETVKALREAIAHRPKAKGDADSKLVFLTRCGTPWVKVSFESNEAGTVTVKVDDAITKEMAKLLKSLKLKRPGLNFYTLRHVFETVGGESRDQPAVDHIMGHARDDMASVYRERISDDRLRAVAYHVRAWLFGKSKRA